MSRHADSLVLVLFGCALTLLAYACDLSNACSIIPLYWAAITGLSRVTQFSPLLVIENSPAVTRLVG